MKIKYCLLAAFACLALPGCGDAVDLPGINVETDLEKIPIPENLAALTEVPSKEKTVPMQHVGGLHTEADFQRIREKLAAEESPWKEGYELLETSPYAALTFQTWPTEWIKRGVAGDENYMNAAHGAAAAYQLGLRWKIEQDDRYAAKAVEILNSWVRTCVGVTGNTNLSLAAGLYGYEFAIAGELLRGYDGWQGQDFAAFQEWLVKVFYPANKDFLVRHHDANPLHYWANWALCNVASVMAIGIVTDRRDIYNEAIEHFQIGETNGRFTRAIYHVYDGEYANFAQLQESGRDQGHTLMCVGLIGTICQLAFNQGDDFFKYRDNMFMKACEYAACYNYTNDPVPYKLYSWQKQDPWGGISPEPQETIGSGGRGNLRPIWALPYYHYKEAGMSDEQLKYTKTAVERCFPEGGGGHYGTASGGFDALGFGTLMYAR